jgi:hypothetical protein
MKTKSKLTQWFRAKEFRPMHVGWYEYRGVGINQVRAYWTGKRWMWKPKDKVMGLWICRSDAWRGLAEKPNGR